MAFIDFSDFIIAGHYVMVCQVEKFANNTELRVSIDDDDYIAKDPEVINDIWKKRQRCQDFSMDVDDKQYMDELLQTINKYIAEKKLLLKRKSQKPKSLTKTKKL